MSNKKDIYPGKWILVDKSFLGVIISKNFSRCWTTLITNEIIQEVIEIQWIEENDFIEIPKNEFPLYAKDYLNIIHSYNYHKFLFNTNLKARFIDNQLLTNTNLIWVTQNE